MKHIIIIIIIILFSTIKLMAQTDFRSGYIINNNKDTIYGLLDYKSNNSNAQKCIYRANINSENQIFTPEKIRAYRFTDSKYYISKPVNTKYGTEQLFLEYLIDGVVDIFYYSDNNGKHYFVNDSAGKLYELKTKKSEEIINNTKYIKEKKEYIGMLKYVFKESPSIKKRANNVVLTHHSLIEITRDYHNEVCFNEKCIIYEKRPSIINSEFGILIGMNGISFSETGELSDYYYLKDNPFGFEVYPSIGVYYKVNMPFVNERVYFQYEGTYSRVKLKTTNSYTEPVYNIIYTNQIEFTLNSFNNTVIIKYEFPKGKIRPTFQLGSFLNYLTIKDYNRNLETEYPWNDKVETSQYKTGVFEKFDYGFNFGVGVKTFYMNDKELFLDLRYQKGFGSINNFNSDTFLINLGFQIGT